MPRSKFSRRRFLRRSARNRRRAWPLSRNGLVDYRAPERAGRDSFYYRFASRDLLLGELWLQTVLAFQEGITAVLDAGDGLGAVLHTPAWVREHLDEARLLLLYHRDDFGQAGWPQQLRDGVAAQTRQIEAGMGRFAHLVFGRDGSGELRRAQFLLAEVPVAAVQQHLRRRELPPPLVDQLIRTTYHAVVADYRMQGS